jgi:hypothetical protein
VIAVESDTLLCESLAALFARAVITELAILVRTNIVVPVDRTEGGDPALGVVQRFSLEEPPTAR